MLLLVSTLIFTLAASSETGSTVQIIETETFETAYETTRNVVDLPHEDTTTTGDPVATVASETHEVTRNVVTETETELVEQESGEQAQTVSLAPEDESSTTETLAASDTTAFVPDRKTEEAAMATVHTRTIPSSTLTVQNAVSNQIAQLKRQEEREAAPQLEAALPLEQDHDSSVAEKYSNAASSESESAEPAKQDTDPLWIIVPIIGVCVLILIVAVVCYIRSSKRVGSRVWVGTKQQFTARSAFAERDSMRSSWRKTDAIRVMPGGDAAISLDEQLDGQHTTSTSKAYRYSDSEFDMDRLSQRYTSANPIQGQLSVFVPGHDSGEESINEVRLSITSITPRVASGNVPNRL